MSQRNKLLVTAGLLGVAAFAGVLVVTEPPGPALSPDSASYLGSAEALARHGSLRIPFADWSDADSTSKLAHFAPGFPLAVAASAALGAPPAQGARFIEAVSALLSVGTLVALVGTEAGLAAGALAGGLFIAAPATLENHLIALSEPMFFVFLALTLATMLRVPDRPLLMGAAAAAATLTRYAGVALPGACAVWAFAQASSLRTRLTRASLAFAPVVAGMAIWTAWAGSAREFGYRPGIVAALPEGARTLAGWLVPLELPDGWRGALAVVVAAGAVALAVASFRLGRHRVMGAALTLVAACYLAVVVLSRLFADEGIRFDSRTLSPVLGLGMVGAASALSGAWGGLRPMWRGVAAAGFGLWLAGSAILTVNEARDVMTYGWGFESSDWQGTPLQRWLTGDGTGHPLFTNNPATLYFLAHRPSRFVPEDDASIAAFGAVLARSGGVLVGFADPLERTVPPDTLARRLGLVLLARFPNGVVWGPPPPERSLGGEVGEVDPSPARRAHDAVAAASRW
jgi:hypothetical protein